MLLSRKDNLSPAYDEHLQRYLFGRECLVEELPFSEEIIKRHVRKRFITLHPGIEPATDGLMALLSGTKRWVCRRCGNTDPREFGYCSCSRCGKTCVYCRHCLNMGVVRACSRLATWSGPAPERTSLPWRDSSRICEWTGTLSDVQEKVADDLDQYQSEGKSFLIWAVCGSGKTEIMFRALEHALRLGERAVLATPRTDVVRELFPRFKAAFPKVPISALYAGSEDKDPEAPFVIATTHQLIRFYRYFDRVFIDEVDAFPYHYDPMLEYAVLKSAKEKAPIAYLTATPPPVLKSAFLSGKLPGAKIARRFHGYPLPVPKDCWAGNWRKLVGQGRLPESFNQWVRAKMESGKQIFVFVPSVTLLREVTELLQKRGLARVAGVHAEDPDRHTKVMFFREGQIRILVTTTILERGVTISGVEAAVLGADDPIFDERALVQIAGRVGRSASQPAGDVIYFHNGRTLEMIRARRHIEQMNSEGGF
ncbi:competence protein [Sporolactobacillus sp. THM7-4]|nr:competence protein [Sporolactobacillus sp. THM7-4]